MTHLYVCHDSFICVTRLICMCAMTHLYVCHAIHMSRIQHTSLSAVTRLNTGWRRLIGSPKLQIIFHKRATKYRLLLQKTTYKDKGSYESSPPCTSRNTHKSVSTSPTWISLYTQSNKSGRIWMSPVTSEWVKATHCNTLQHTATHCNTPQHTAWVRSHLNELKHAHTHTRHDHFHMNQTRHT